MRFLVAEGAETRAINSKRLGMLSDGIVLLHDNVCPHTANPVRDKLRDLSGKHF